MGEELVEMIRQKIECDGEHPHDSRGQLLHLAVIRSPRITEASWLSWPWSRHVAELEGSGIIECRVALERTGVERFFQIGWRGIAA